MDAKLGLVAACVGLTLGSASNADAQCTFPHVFTNGQTADATQLMANFNALANCLAPGGATNSIQYNTGSGILGGIGPLTDGQLLIGSASNPPQAQALAASTGISVSNAPGSVTIAATGAVGLNGLYRQVLSATPTAASTGLASWMNQGGATVGDGPTGIVVTAPASGGHSVIGRYGAAPTPPYKINILVAITRSSNSFNHVGLGWYNGSNRLQIIDFATYGGGANFIEVTQWNTPTSHNASPFVSPVNGFPQPIWLQIADDGTNVSFAFSQDGANYLPVFSVAKSTGWLGSTGYSNVVFTVNPVGPTTTLGTLMSWTQN